MKEIEVPLGRAAALRLAKSLRSSPTVRFVTYTEPLDDDYLDGALSIGVRVNESPQCFVFDILPSNPTNGEQRYISPYNSLPFNIVAKDLNEALLGVTMLVWGDANAFVSALEKRFSKAGKAIAAVGWLDLRKLFLAYADDKAFNEPPSVADAMHYFGLTATIPQKVVDHAAWSEDLVTLLACMSRTRTLTPATASVGQHVRLLSDFPFGSNELLVLAGSVGHITSLESWRVINRVYAKVAIEDQPGVFVKVSVDLLADADEIALNA